MTEPHQLTLWPEDALPGQLPLFNRGPEVGIPSGHSAQYCQRCQSVIAAFLASRGTVSIGNPPAAEPTRESDVWVGERPPMETVPAASTYF